MWDVFAKAVSVAKVAKAVVVITSDGASTCNRLTSGGKGTEPIIAKFFRRDTKHQLMKKQMN